MKRFFQISCNEIKSRALAFARDWADVSSEDAEAKTFWNEFFHIFGISRRRVATFEQRVKKINGRDGYDDTQHYFPLQDPHKYVRLFGFIAGYQTHAIREEDPVNIKAAERMGRLHDLLKDVGYTEHSLELYLVRLLFCLFADDTGIFQRQQSPVSGRIMEKIRKSQP